MPASTKDMNTIKTALREQYGFSNERAKEGAAAVESALALVLEQPGELIHRFSAHSHRDAAVLSCLLIVAIQAWLDEQARLDLAVDTLKIAQLHVRLERGR